MASVLRSLAVFLSLLLALPPSWCCFLSVPGLDSQPEATPAEPSCCHTPDKTPTPEAPLPPLCPCCLPTDQALPQGKVLLPGPDFSFLPHLPSSPVGVMVLACAADGPSPFFVSVSLHLLHCVWTC